MARLRKIAAAVPARHLVEDVAGAVILAVLVWNLPTIIAVLDAVFGAGR